MLDLENPEESYFVGFFLADGNLHRQSRNRGRASIEIKSCDSYIIERFKEIIPVSSTISKRSRATNYSGGKEAEFTKISIYDLGFRDALVSLGIPEGKKSLNISEPNAPFIKKDFYRGIVDGDGSLGITGEGFPFLSLVTASDEICKGFIRYIKELTGHTVKSSRNTRDGVYNISIYKEKAQKVSQDMYYSGCLSLPRKYSKSLDVGKWVRPSSMRRVTWSRKRWTEEEDEFLLGHTLEESVEELVRTFKSVQIRKIRLEKKNL
jgi:hypothetical protein